MKKPFWLCLKDRKGVVRPIGWGWAETEEEVYALLPSSFQVDSVEPITGDPPSTPHVLFGAESIIPGN